MNIRNRIKEMRIVTPDEVAPNPRNWRTHPQEQRAALRGVLSEVGIAAPVIAYETPSGLMLIDGHERMTLGVPFPAVILDVSEEEALILLATFDPITNLAGVNAGALESLLQDVNIDNDAINDMLNSIAEDAGIEFLYDEDLSETDAVVKPGVLDARDDRAVSKTATQEPESEDEDNEDEDEDEGSIEKPRPSPIDTSTIIEDDAPEVSESVFITKPGDLWVLGDHRLLCGDSTKELDVQLLMNGKLANLLLTDPPYNVAYTGATADALTIQNDSMSDKNFREFLVKFYRCSFDIMEPGASFYIWHSSSEAENFIGAVKDCNQQVRQTLVWVKNALVLSRQDYHWQHEPCLYGWKLGAAHSWYSDRKQTTLLRFDKPSRSGEHPTMKPVALFAYQMANSSKEGDIVYDPFLGSGTSMIAAEQIGRSCYGMEIDPRYCDVIIKRWEQLTGKKAVIAGNTTNR